MPKWILHGKDMNATGPVASRPKVDIKHIVGLVVGAGAGLFLAKKASMHPAIGALAGGAAGFFGANLIPSKPSAPPVAVGKQTGLGAGMGTVADAGAKVSDTTFQVSYAKPSSSFQEGEMDDMANATGKKKPIFKGDVYFAATGKKKPIFKGDVSFNAAGRKPIFKGDVTFMGDDLNAAGDVLEKKGRPVGGKFGSEPLPIPGIY